LLVGCLPVGFSLVGFLLVDFSLVGFLLSCCLLALAACRATQALTAQRRRP